ncbi:HU family DNA-binding protein [Flavobacterium sp.]|uniref:HU family DNA-binding protein n=1 Tax=Flavobacterium sp. TaxID=239 RepID=UPI001B3F7B5B|nr:HU family DNA-binding protein [Flavobacterium sp.]MBP6181903.1 HU family DNA-binding protein [Flavobacterium sp.]
MAIPFSPSGKTNPNIVSAPMRYYPRASNSGEIDLDELAEQVSFSCTATPADCYAVILSLVDVVSSSLENGKIVRLGHLGSFQISIKGVGSDTPEAVKAQNVKSASILFRPGRKLKKMLSQLVFVPKKK